ncbi:MAG TPA: hypothetical protein VK750_05360 [Cytophagaceae bacterium]|jgi:hypothetical protein|nr:hypothetical protein [Cytophagaceae bacterium]
MSHLDKIHKAFEYSSAEFDKSVTFIASGAFGLSMAFIDKIVDVHTAHCKGLLITAWYCFGGTIFISLLAHYISLNANIWASKNITGEFTGDKTDPEQVNKHNTSVLKYHAGVDKRNRVINSFNLTMIIALLVGIIFFIIFIQTNINNSTMSKEKATGQAPAQGSNNNGNSQRPSEYNNRHIGENFQNGHLPPDQKAMVIPTQPVITITVAPAPNKSE